MPNSRSCPQHVCAQAKPLDEWNFLLLIGFHNIHRFVYNNLATHPNEEYGTRNFTHFANILNYIDVIGMFYVKMMFVGQWIFAMTSMQEEERQYSYSSVFTALLELKIYCK